MSADDGEGIDTRDAPTPAVERPPGLALCEFRCREQVVKVWTCEVFHGVVLDTAMDLTGFMIWPASHLLAAYLCSHPQLLTDKSVLELGCGAGLCGTLCARTARTVVLSDMSVPVLRLVEEGVRATEPPPGADTRARIRCRQLEWGHAEHHAALRREFPDGFDVVLGADIVYPGSNAELRLEALVRCVSELLRGRPQAVFVCAYLSRHQSTDVALANGARQRGLAWEVVPPATFVTAADYFPEVLHDACVIVFRLDAQATAALAEPAFDLDHLPPWSRTMCGRPCSPQSWDAPGDDFWT